LDGDLRLFLEQWEVSEVLCTGSSLPISSHALRHHSCTKGFYQTNGCSRWTSLQSTNSHFYVSGRLASQKSDSRIVTNCDAEGHGSKLVMNFLYTKPQILPVETWEFVGMHLADLRWTPTPPHGGLEWLILVFPSWNEISPCIHWEVSSLILGHVSISQEVSEILCTGSSLPISSHALRHHSCTKGFYQTNGRSRWA
jgi:hypothetical protein